MFCKSSHLTRYYSVFSKSPHLTRYYIIVLCFANHLTSLDTILYRVYVFTSLDIEYVVCFANHFTYRREPSFAVQDHPLAMNFRTAMLLHHPQLQVLSDFAFFWLIHTSYTSMYIDIDFICLSFIHVD